MGNEATGGNIGLSFGDRARLGVGVDVKNGFGLRHEIPRKQSVYYHTSCLPKS
jgi:hypothetical protein